MNKEYSLKENHKIENLVKHKKSVGSKYYAIYFRSSDNLKIAYSISKKYGHAVDRNYAKRVTREIIRKQIITLPSVEMLIIIKPLSETLNYSEKEKQLNYVLKKLKQEEKENANEKRKK